MTRPNVKDKVIAFQRTHPNASAKDIAKALGVGEKSVTTAGYRYGIEFQSGRGASVYVPRDVALMLDAPALERGLTISELSNKLLATIAMDGLVGAILDE